MQTSVTKKTLLLSILLLVAGSACAEWIDIGSTDDGTSYFDPATIRKDGNLRKVWLLNDLKQRDKDGAMSMRMRFEFDCKSERYKTLSTSTHSEPMARGKTLSVYQFNDADWVDTPPSSVADFILQKVCTQ